MSKSEVTARGVDALINRLRTEGVSAGEAEAADIKARAEQEAARLLHQAQAEAEQIKADARHDADTYRRAGEEALNTAMRDAILAMKAGLIAAFEADIKRLVSKEMADPALLRQIILEVAGRMAKEVDETEQAEIILPREIVGPDAIRQNPDDIQSGVLTHYVLGLTQELLRKGVTLHAAADLHGGILVRIKNRDIVLDLSDDAVASVLLQHLQPRFRAVLEGVIR